MAFKGAQGREAPERGPFPFQEGRLYLTFKPRNLLVSVTDASGRVHASYSAGTFKYTNSLKRSPVAAEETVKGALADARSRGLRRAALILKGFGSGRSHALKKVVEFRDVSFTSVEERTQIPFGGCRPRKAKKR